MTFSLAFGTLRLEYFSFDFTIDVLPSFTFKFNFRVGSRPNLDETCSYPSYTVWFWFCVGHFYLKSSKTACRKRCGQETRYAMRDSGVSL